jgi:CubicO group peptidase (beta-lactamase class C family)
MHAEVRPRWPGLFGCCALGAVGLALLLLPRIAAAEPDEAALGKAQGYPLGTAETMYTDPFKVGSFSATDKIRKSRFVTHGDKVLPLEHAPSREITYQYQGQRRTLADYLNRRRVTGLLILKGNQIVAEHYRYGRTAADRFVSFSMAKSVNSLLVGIALEKGILGSLDDPAEKYVPELRGSGYGQAKLRNLLRMASGVKFVEEYNGHDDIARLHRAQVGLSSERPLDVLASYRQQNFPGGQRFGYGSSETTVVGYALARAAGKDIATLTREWLWQPMGAEADAAWNLAVDGQEQTEGGFNATLRDYGRLGVLLAYDGRLGERQIVPREYLLDATDATRQPQAFRPRVATPYSGYGYQFWIFPLRVRTFALQGIFGQCIFIQPESKLVMVQTAVNERPTGGDSGTERDALWRGVLTALGGSTEP